MAAGNRHLGYKAALNAVEATLARGRRRRSTSASSSAWRRCSPTRRRQPSTSSAPLRDVRRADDRRGVRVLPARRPGTAHEPVPVELVPAGTAAGDDRVSGPFAYGDKVLLLDAKRRRYLDRAEGRRRVPQPRRLRRRTPTSSVSPRGGRREVDHGAAYTCCARRSRTSSSRCRGAQVIYPKDLAPICMLADIGPGVRVLESGVGSGRCR